MKKNFMKKMVSLATATIMVTSLLPSTVFAAGGAGVVGLTSSVTSATYALGVPKTVPVAINPQLVGLAADGSEDGYKGITTPAIVFTNLSNLPVAIDVSILPKVADSVELVAEATDVSVSKADTSKNAYVFVEPALTCELPATGLTTLPITTFTSDTDAPATGECLDFDAADKGSEIEAIEYSMVLAAADFNSTIKAVNFGADGGAAFKLGGQVSAYGGWLANDFTVGLVYDAQTILSSEETTLAGGTAATTGAHRSVEKDASALSAMQINMVADSATPVDIDIDVSNLPASFATGATATISTTTGKQTNIAATMATVTGATNATKVTITPIVNATTNVSTFKGGAVYVAVTDTNSNTVYLPLTINMIAK